MRLLVLGGTSFVGRHLVEQALAHGHDVTLANRGTTAPRLFPDAEHRRIDRTSGDYRSLGDGRWDATVDVSAYVPRSVRQALAALDGRGGHYVQVSSVSAYDETRARQTEDSPLWPLPAPDTEEVTDETYGPLKAACERAALGVLGASRVAIVRPTYVVGPHDPTDRFTYWVRRMAKGGRVAVVDPRAPAQVVDARDLGAFLLTCARTRVTGVMDAVGPWAPFGDMLAQMAPPERSTTLVPVPFAAVEAAGVTLPLLNQGAAALMSRPGTHAVAAGLHTRSLRETAADTLAWDRERGSPPLRTGPTAAQEHALLHASSGSDGVPPPV
jgi:2'-hydroxyisoflavone reductase